MDTENARSPVYAQSMRKEQNKLEHPLQIQLITEYRMKAGCNQT